jgi:sugar phosphate isomerase/epimerase
VKSAVTISLVPEARGGPFVFWDDLRDACRVAAEMGFDAVEIFPPSAAYLESLNFASVLSDYGLKLAAVGTGAGWVKHKLTLCSSDEAIRLSAVDFGSKIIAIAGEIGAPAIIGSMQGRGTSDGEREHLQHSLQSLAERSMQYEVPLLYEPLNRYETNFANTLDAGTDLIRATQAGNVRLLADLFHMNIEESNVADAIRRNGELVGHVHLADSNRRPAGNGHTDLAAIAAELREVGYDGYISAEAFPYPDSESAARATMDAFNRYFRA